MKYSCSFHISAQNIDCGYLLETSTIYVLSRNMKTNKSHNLCFEQKYENYQDISSESFHFLMVKFSIYLNRRVFVMYMKVHEGL